MKRNYNIDFLRGLVTISIIYIHTVWWSGQTYLPPIVSNLSLLLDVPAFMFIAGISFNYINSIIKNLKNIFNQWKKYIFFIIIYSLILIIFFKDFSVKTNFIHWLTYNFPYNNDLLVVGGSIWFMPMYIQVSILCSIIICAIKYYDKENEIKDLKIVSYVLLIIFLYTQYGSNILFINSTVAMYALIYLLGYISHKIKIKNFIKFLSLEICLLLTTFIIFKLNNYNLTMLQNFKFPSQFPYLLTSGFSIILIWYLKDKIKIKNNLITKIGSNALFFYFAQGIGASLIYFLLDKIVLKNIYLKLLIMFSINLINTLLLGSLMVIIYNWLSKNKYIKKYIKL